jgi:type III secretion system YscQ/HrcQ family protein
LPEDHAALHAWLGERLTAATPALAELLGASPHLELLRLHAPGVPMDAENSAAPGGPRPFGPDDLEIRLGVPGGGAAHLVLTADLVGALLGALGVGSDDEPPADEAPASDFNAGPGSSGGLGLEPDHGLDHDLDHDNGPWIPAPVSSWEAGLLAGVVAAALADLAPEGVTIESVDRAAPPSTPRFAAHPNHDAPALPVALRCATRWAVGPHGGWLHAALDDEAAHRLRRAARATPPPVAEARARRVPLRARFLAARATLAAAEVAALEPGDVLAFFEKPPASAGTVRGWLAIGAWQHPARLQRTADGRRLILETEPVLEPELETQTEPKPKPKPKPKPDSDSEPESGFGEDVSAESETTPEPGEEIAADPDFEPDPPDPPDPPNPATAFEVAAVAEPGLSTTAVGMPAAFDPAAPRRSPPSQSAHSPRPHSLRPEESAMPEDSPGPGSARAALSPEATARLAELPVTLTVSLGELTLSAADVARLAPGAVIELDRPVGEPVEIRAGERPLARGELVDVDGALGVRIVELTR